MDDCISPTTKIPIFDFSGRGALVFYFVFFLLLCQPSRGEPSPLCGSVEDQEGNLRRYAARLRISLGTAARSAAAGLVTRIGGWYAGSLGNGEEGNSPAAWVKGARGGLQEGWGMGRGLIAAGLVTGFGSLPYHKATPDTLEIRPAADGKRCGMTSATSELRGDRPDHCIGLPDR